MSTARGSHLTRVLEFDVVFLRRFLGTGLDLSPEGVARVDEAALRRSLNSPELLHAQLDQRLAMNERSNISVQIAPLGFGGHAAGGGPFSILRFAVPDLSDTVYLEMTVACSRLYGDQQDGEERARAVACTLTGVET